MDIHPAIYLDYNATTPVAPEVMKEMLPYFLSVYGNPSSNDHIMGWQAKEAVEVARESLAAALKVNSDEIIFTAGATESINLILRSLLLAKSDESMNIITLKSEHNAVLDTCADLEKAGIEVCYLNVDKNGLVDLQALEDKINQHTKMVAIMMVNNETGVIQPMAEIAAICQRKKVLLMSDATQAIGKIAVCPQEIGIDIIVGSAHKFYGPKGVGFLYAKKEVRQTLVPIITGGGQERKKRAGTLNVPSIVGMGKAITLASELMTEDLARIEKRRNDFEKKLHEMLSIQVIGADAPRLYNTSNIIFHGIDSEQLMSAIGSHVAASRGSACSTGKIEPSHVLSAMGITETDALSAIRFSFGRYTTKHEVDAASQLITEAVNRIKPKIVIRLPIP